VSVFDAILLAILQGMTEFLPVSSSGHLVLAQHMLNLHGPQIVEFDVFVHFGTLISIVMIFKKDIFEMLRSIFEAGTTLQFKNEYDTKEYFRLAIAVLVGTIPAGVVGLLFRQQIQETFTDPKFAAMNIVITGLILFLTRLAKPEKGKMVGIVSSLIIGIAQAIAILPGISRSGTTMSTALYLKINPVQAARFSFLLSVPVIAGAALLESYQIVQQGTALGFLPILVGVVISAGAGYVAIKLLLKIMEKGKFSLFSFYCLAIGIVGIFFI
jgi:undecaprenyl-diphosphatase